jgi:hypothetical protein
VLAVLAARFGAADALEGVVGEVAAQEQLDHREYLGRDHGDRRGVGSRGLWGEGCGVDEVAAEQGELAAQFVKAPARVGWCGAGRVEGGVRDAAPGPSAWGWVMPLLRCRRQDSGTWAVGSSVGCRAMWCWLRRGCQATGLPQRRQRPVCDMPPGVWRVVQVRWRGRRGRPPPGSGRQGGRAWPRRCQESPGRSHVRAAGMPRSAQPGKTHIRACACCSLFRVGLSDLARGRAGRAQGWGVSGGVWLEHGVPSSWSSGMSKAWAGVCQVVMVLVVRLFQVDDGAAGQAGAAGEFVVGPPAVSPQTRELQVQRVEVGVGREDRHPTIRWCRPLRRRCRGLYFLLVKG